MLNKPIFIICIHRSGSTLLRNILDANSEVAMATDEMHISVPYYRTLDNIFSGLDLDREAGVEKLCDKIFSGDIRGSFWRDYRTTGVSRDSVCREIKKSDRTLKSVIEILLHEYMKSREKKRVGVKYPLHPGRAEQLEDWFPDCKIICLTRDPRAVIASKLNDKATRERKRKFGVFSFIIHYITMLLFIFDFIWFSRIIRRNRERYFILKYEEIGKDPEKMISEICEFLEIPYEPEMLKVSGKPSSHTSSTESGFDRSRINRWRTVLNRFDQFIIKVACRRAMRRVGY